MKSSSDLGDAGKGEVRQAGFEFYDWGTQHSGAARFVVSWDQREEDVSALCALYSSRISSRSSV
jgi:threonine aldolase